LRILEVRRVERGGSGAGDRTQAGQACPLREGLRVSCARIAEEEVHESVFRRGPVLDHTCLHQRGQRRRRMWSGLPQHLAGCVCRRWLGSRRERTERMSGRRASASVLSLSIRLAQTLQGLRARRLKRDHNLTRRLVPPQTAAFSAALGAYCGSSKAAWEPNRSSPARPTGQRSVMPLAKQLEQYALAAGRLFALRNRRSCIRGENLGG
jgi:hypothetical protein